MIKLVISDLDGTLLDSDGKLPDWAPTLVSRLRERGILFTIASGRAEWFVKPLVEGMGIDCPYLACNGGTVMHGAETLRRKQFPLSLVEELVRRTEQLKLSCIYTINGIERVTALDKWIIRQGEKKDLPFVPEPFSREEWQTMSIEKLLVYDPEKTGFIAEIDAMCGDAIAHVRYARAIEITEKTVNKAEGMAFLLEYLHIKPSETLVVADDQNDLEILAMAGIGAAVANASADAKAAAGYICEHERSEGVREAVGKFCLTESICRGGVV